MKRTLLKTMLCIVIAVIIALTMIGCENDASVDGDDRTIGNVRFHKGGDCNWDDEKNVKYDIAELTYDLETRIVYIRNYGSHFYTTLTPYYSENGKLCRYINGEIVEIDN